METHFANIERAHSDLARERVLEDLRVLVRDSETLLKATAGDLTEKAKDARTRLGAALERAKATSEALQQQAVVAAKAAAKKADVVVREHPYHSVGVAFGVGLLIGVLVARRPPQD
ncbi:MAG TPA: DUF883 domain-containing protein [Candidatus Paceibacterota bacterium]|nr:DUF883 domain-containing protein [Verrucomicrobiota bacterium]HSA10766.1 DUF883 domain-containing protein [Candidatus Paceibacterota bacterium]